jgi:hypothetical protein
MPSEETQEGTVAIGVTNVPVVVGDVAYGNPLDELNARRAADEAGGQVFRGEDWADLPNFYCPLCGYASLEGDLAVVTHGQYRHPGVDLKEHIRG